MSYAQRQYSRAPNAYQRSAYAEPTYVDVQQPYHQQAYPQQAYPQQSYVQQPHSYTSHGHHRHHYPSSQIIGQGYGTSGRQYVTSGGRFHNYYPSSRHSRSHRHAPQIITGSTQNLGQYTTASYAPNSSSSRYRAEGSGGRPVEILSGRSYRDEGVPLSTRIRRLFGLGPKRSSGHHGVAIHVKRGSDGRYRTRHDSGHSGSRVYTI